jgi:arylsulfate sulfotransferase
MKPRVRDFILMLGLVVLVACSVVVAAGSGLLVKPTAGSLARLKEVPQYDVLEWQAEREREIVREYGVGTFTLDKPFVVLDPYEMNPLTALVLFETEQPSTIDVTIRGDDEHSTFSYRIDEPIASHQIPVLGLYPGRDNAVLVKSTDGSGRTETGTLSIATEPLPPDFQTYRLESSSPEQMEPGITLCIACFEHSYTCIIDSQGMVRGYLSNRRMAHGTSIVQLRNGNLLATGDEYKQVPYNMSSLWEINWLGKVFREYEIPNAVHHDMTELPNGDMLCASNAKDMFESGTREDVAIVIDRQTGMVKQGYDFRAILDENREPHHHFNPGIINPPSVDWMHMNTVVWDERDAGIIVSSPIQSMVVKIDSATSAVKWILGPPEGYDGHSADLEKYLLTPVGDGFEWQWCQHEPVILPDQDSNPATLDILLLDNGQSRSFTETGSVPPEKNYSRGVQYRIDEERMTVRQVWQYGEERGSDCYATFLGDADYLSATGNRLMAFGGQLRNNGVPTDEIFAGVMGQGSIESRIVEVTESGQVVFEVVATGNEYSTSAETYQTERLDLYSPESLDYRLGESRGERVGQRYVCVLDTDFSPPPVYAGSLGVKFNALHREDNRLVVDGELSWKGTTYLLGRAYLIFRSTDAVRVFAANTGLNSRFFASISLDALPKGVYQLSVAGAIRVGNDTQSGTLFSGYARTEYKVTKE